MNLNTLISFAFGRQGQQQSFFIITLQKKKKKKTQVKKE
jgi:hypothetical protein